MSSGDIEFSGSIPEAYDRLLVPLIFEPYARDLAERVMAGAPTVVLETAAGSGVVTRMLAARLPAKARYAVTDLNQPMLDQAARRQGKDERIEWRQADALDLPFEDGTFDVVCCQFGVMFFPDKVAGYKEALRVLRPGGRFVLNVWDRIESNELANDVVDGLAAHFPDDPPRFLARLPHGYHDIAAISDHLRQAGFSQILSESVDHISRADSAMDAAVALCQASPMRTEIEARDPNALQKATERVAQLMASRRGKGAVEGKMRAHVFVASA